jgi:hypothetical protein
VWGIPAMASSPIQTRTWHSHTQMSLTSVNWRHWHHSQRSTVKYWRTRQNCYAMHTFPDLLLLFVITSRPALTDSTTTSQRLLFTSVPAGRANNACEDCRATKLFISPAASHYAPSLSSPISDGYPRAKAIGTWSFTVTYLICSMACRLSPTNPDAFLVSSLYLHAQPLNFVVEWLALLLCIREVPGSNLGPETGYPDWGFPQSFQANTEIVPFIRPRPLSSTSFSIHYSLSSSHSTLYSLRYWKRH